LNVSPTYFLVYLTTPASLTQDNTGYFPAKAAVRCDTNALRRLTHGPLFSGIGLASLGAVGAAMTVLSWVRPALYESLYPSFNPLARPITVLDPRVISTVYTPLGTFDFFLIWLGGLLFIVTWFAVSALKDWITG